MPLSQVPVAVQHEVVSAEDRSFYTNKGIDPRGIARAFYNNIRGGAEQGGSTITQQYVKNYFLDQNRTLSRKFKEFFISIKIDRSTDKNAILQDYLNTIYFGRGAYGIQAASQAYFGVDVSKLTPARGRGAGQRDPGARALRPGDQPGPGQGPLELRDVRHGAGQVPDPGPGRRAHVPQGPGPAQELGARRAPPATCSTSSAARSRPSCT